jgi:hypothetical protein
VRAAGQVPAPGQFTDVSVSDLLGQVLSRFRDPCARGRLPAPQGDHRCRDFRKLLRVVWPGPLLGQVLLEVPEHGGDAASPSLKEVSVQGGKLRVGKDEGREGGSRVGEAPVGRCRTSAFDGCTQGWPGRLLPPRAGRSPQRGPRRCQSSRWDSLPWLSCTSARCSVSGSSPAGRRSAASGLNLARPRQ